MEDRKRGRKWTLDKAEREREWTGTNEIKKWTVHRERERDSAERERERGRWAWSRGESGQWSGGRSVKERVRVGREMDSK